MLQFAERRLTRYESILLDPIYTGKAMDRLIGLIVDEGHFSKGENIPFLHTGGNVSLFGCMTRIDSFLACGTCGELRSAGVATTR